MIEFEIEGKKAGEVIAFESKMFEKHKDIANLYLPSFKEKGYTLKVDIQWRNFRNGTWSVERLPMKSGYECHLYYIVEKNGEEVVINSNDGEDYCYPLIADSKIDYIHRFFHRLKVSYYPTVDDVDEDLENFLSQLERL